MTNKVALPQDASSFLKGESAKSTTPKISTQPQPYIYILQFLKVMVHITMHACITSFVLRKPKMGVKIPLY